ncbi:MAG: PKD domain-containing protein [Bernardetiaceae bacterium]|nr:PKD domain-containing protein [Bernardetiaceae bacterium]
MRVNFYLSYIILTLSILCFSMLKLKAQGTDLQPLSDKLMVKVKASASARTAEHFANVPLQKLQIKETKSTFSDIIRNSPRTRQQANMRKAPLPEGVKTDIENLHQVTIAEGQTVEEAIAYFSAQDWVEYAEPIYPHELMGPPPPYIPDDPMVQWHLNVSQFYQAWGLHQGDTNTVIGIIDTGLFKGHPDLIGNVYYNNAERYGTPGFDDDGNGFVDDSLGYDFGDWNADVSDVHAHGTAVAGMSSAVVDNGIGIAGGGFKCRFMPLKVMNSSMRIVNMFEAMVYGAENGCDIINLSLGRAYVRFQWEQEVINYVALERDVSIIASAGNAFHEMDYYPAAYQYVLSVAHSQSSDARANGTFHRSISIMAPGLGTLTTYNPFFPPGGWYRWGTGSSFAAPLTAGAVGLVRSAFPELTGLQANELVRVTSDNRYDLPANAPYLEKIGYGRLNAFRALAERNIAKSVRMDNFSYQGSHPDFAVSGDVIEITADFINYLAPTSSNLKIKISTESPYATVIDSVFNMGATPTLERRTNSDQKYRIAVAADAPLNHAIIVRLGYEDGDYNDYEYFTVYANPKSLVIPFNTMSYALNSNGRWGFYDRSFRYGDAIRADDDMVLTDGGLMIAQSSTKVSDCVITHPPSGFFNNHFTIENAPDYNEQTPFYKEAQTAFSDTAAHPTPIGVHVSKRVWGNTNTPHHKYIIAEYSIRNVSGAFIDSLNVGLYADWNIGNFNNNYARWDNVRQFGYVYEPGGKYAAIKSTQPNRNYFALDLTDVGGDNINLLDSFTVAEKYQTLSQRIKRPEAGFLTTGNNVAHVVGSTIFAINAGETRIIRFIISTGNSLPEVIQAIQQAELSLNPTTSRSPAPLLSDTLCATPPYLVSPSGGSQFRFYKTDNTQTPVHIGATYTIPPSEINVPLYVTNVDSTLEGTPGYVKFQAILNEPEVDFSLPDTLDITTGAPLLVTATGSTPLISWTWNFGDGTPDVTGASSLSHNYNSQGLFEVSLHATDTFGCEKIVTRSLWVVRKSPTPIIGTIPQACPEQEVTIAPEGGSHFKFFDMNGELLHSGSELTLNGVTHDSVYVANYDSLRPSERVFVRIRRTVLAPQINASPMFDSVLYANVVFRDIGENQYNTIERRWDFGDGTAPKFGALVTHTYAAQGIYTVRLKVTDVTGCVVEVSREFRVGKRADAPLLPSVITICKNGSAVIKPEIGTNFNFYTDTTEAPIASGRAYILEYAEDMPDVIYVTRTDSIIESIATAVFIEHIEAIANFEFNRELFLNESNTVNFEDRSPDAVYWEWDFGNGRTSFLQNPSSQFFAEGEYEIRLRIRDSRGCEAERTKILTTFSRSPQPQHPPVYICHNDSVTLTPRGGSLFRFYRGNTDTEPVHVGNSYHLGWVTAPQTYFITCADSTLESVARRVDVLLSKPFADFEMSSDTVNLFYRETLTLTDRSEGATRRRWQVSSGVGSAEAEWEVAFEEKGTYEIRLVAFDSLGCIDTLSRFVQVIDTPIINAIDSNKNYSLMVYPNPTTDIVNVILNLRQSQFAQLSVYDNRGVSVLELPRKQITQEHYVLDLKRLSHGMYHLRIVMDSEVIYYKIVLQK